MPAASLIDAERFTYSEAARKVGVHVSTLHRWRLKGVNGRRLRVLKIGGRSYVTRPELESFVASLSDPGAAGEPVPSATDRADEAGRKLTAIGL